MRIVIGADHGGFGGAKREVVQFLRERGGSPVEDWAPTRKNRAIIRILPIRLPGRWRQAILIWVF